MPKRTDLSSILIIGSGPIVIGQACEFDYSGVQACKALRQEGYRVVLVNSNPATIMTDPETADATYVEPLTVEVLEKIIAAERPSALLPTVGGQTALNLGVALAESGVLLKYGVELIGADLRAMQVAEDRELFKDAMTAAGLESPRSGVARTLEEARRIAQEIGRYPLFIRPSFTLGGSGAGTVFTPQEFDEKVLWGLRESPVHTVLVEESLIGWKEYELEVMRDRADNFVVVCTIENFDPMGVHTGDSITVAPAQTLTDKEYQRLRDQARLVMRAVGVETGGSNVQFAVDPNSGRVVVIEMNPRVSRSSALASKATGFPIAKLAAKVAVGYTLDELRNDITQQTVAAFEPSIDYVVVKFPRWAFEKFPGVDRVLGPQMKSVGEAMAIGRTFKEALQKAVRSLEIGRDGLGPLERDADGHIKGWEKDTSIHDLLRVPNRDRIFAAYEALARGDSEATVCRIAGFDPWFVAQMGEIVRFAQNLRTLDEYTLRRAKRMGFSDSQIARLLNENGASPGPSLGAVQPAQPVSGAPSLGPVNAQPVPGSGHQVEGGQEGVAGARHAGSPDDAQPVPGSGHQVEGGQEGVAGARHAGSPDDAQPVGGSGHQVASGQEDLAGARHAGWREDDVRRLREAYGILPTYHQVDTCAAEFESYTPYLYSSYESADEAPPSERRKVMILGGGPNRIGQGIEFDYCCCHASFALQELGYETIMVNCNPETVSTDYDTSDRLYFEPLTHEDVLNIVAREQRAGTLHGVIVQFGGQTPLNLSARLAASGAPILGTSPEAIDGAEDRDLFGALLERLDIPSPAHGTARSVEEAVTVAAQVGYPVVVRPSYVLGGRAMAIVDGEETLRRYMVEALSAAPARPILIDQFLEDAFEVDVDAVSDGETLVIGGIMQHIEEAGIHSGDSACVLPPYKISSYHLSIIAEYTEKLGLALGVVGLMNVQYAIKDDVVYVLEVNPRASRTVPFVSKATGAPLAKIAAKVMAGQCLAELGFTEQPAVKGFFVKEAVLPWKKFTGIDALLGPEMRSTGEVMGHAASFGHAFAKSQLGAGAGLPQGGGVLITVNDYDKGSALKIARDLGRLGFTIYATAGTGAFFAQAGLAVNVLAKGSSGQVGNTTLDAIGEGKIQLIINTPLGAGAREDGVKIRRLATRLEIPLITTLSAAQAAVSGIRALRERELSVRSLQEHYVRG